jgi:nicotinamide mononucleotide transporter
MYALKNYFNDWNLWDWTWTITASIIAVWLGLHWAPGGWRTGLSIITCLTGLWCVILVAKGRLLNYYVGIINVLGYGYIAYEYQLYGEVMLNIGYFLPMQFVGLFIWYRNINPDTVDTVKVKFITWGGRACLASVTLLATMIYAFILTEMGDPLPWLDSCSTVLSVIAMILMAWRYMEQWILWIIVDIVSIWMWWLTIDANGARDIAILVMWSAYLINAVYGFIMWIKMYDGLPSSKRGSYSPTRRAAF